MPRIPYPDTDSLAGPVRRTLEAAPLNVIRMGAHASPVLFEAQGRLGYAVADPEVLEPRIREAAILRVAHLSGSDYELHHHIGLASLAGLTGAELAGLAAQDYASFEPLLAAVCRFTDEVVLRVSPTDATLAALRANVSDRVLVNLVLTIGCYMSIARLAAVTGVEPDQAALEHLSSGPADPYR